MLSIVSLLGTDSYILTVLGESKKMANYHYRLLLSILLISLLISALFAYFFNLFYHEGFHFILYTVALTSLILVSYGAQSKILSSSSILYRNISFPLIVILCLVCSLCFNIQLTPEKILIYSSITFLILTTFTLYLLYHLIDKGVDTHSFSINSLSMAYKSGFLFMPFSLSFTIINVSDVIILGILSDYHQTGVYSIAIALASFGSVGLLTINCFMPLLIRRLYSINKLNVLNILIKNMNVISSALLIPAFLIGALVILAKFYNSTNLYEYIFTYIIYFAGVSANVVFGPCGYVLNMTGKAKKSSSIILQAALINVVIGILLAKPLGSIGVAIGAAWATVYMNYKMHSYAKTNIGIIPGIILKN